jgi:hypothetical protein
VCPSLDVLIIAYLGEFVKRFSKKIPDFFLYPLPGQFADLLSGCVASDGYTKFDGAEPVSPRFFLPVVGGVPLLTVIIIAGFRTEYKS